MPPWSKADQLHYVQRTPWEGGKSPKPPPAIAATAPAHRVFPVALTICISGASSLTE